MEGGREGGREACDLTVHLTSLDLPWFDFSKCWSQKENPQSVFWPRPLFYPRLWPTGWAPSHPSIPGLLQLLSNREPDMGRGTQQRKSTSVMWLHLTFLAPQCPQPLGQSWHATQITKRRARTAHSFIDGHQNSACQMKGIYLQFIVLAIYQEKMIWLNSITRQKYAKCHFWEWSLRLKEE